MDTAELLQYHSNSASNECKKWHVETLHTASDSSRWRLVALKVFAQTLITIHLFT